MPKSVYTESYRRFIKMLIGARTDAGVTQAQLAQRIGWQQTDISKAERGERRLDVVEFLQFAAALEIDAAKFITALQAPRRR